MKIARRAAIVVLVAFATYSLVTGVGVIRNAITGSGISVLVILAAVAAGGVFSLRHS